MFACLLVYLLRLCVCMMYAHVYMHVHDKVYLWRSEDNLGSSSLHPSFLEAGSLCVFCCRGIFWACWLSSFWGDSPVSASHFTVVSLRQQTCTTIQSWRFEHRSSRLCGKTLPTSPSLQLIGIFSHG